MRENKKELFNDKKYIIEEAGKCLNCAGKPCEKFGCPMNTKIPSFINLIKEEKIEEAYYLLNENNMFSHICSIICPQEEQCEGKCVRGINGEPNKIGLLEEYVNYCAKEMGLKPPKIVLEEDRKERVAIVGSGPSGLECALELRKKGYQVDVYEKEAKIGGLLEYEIPDFRLDKKYLHDIVKRLKEIGINFYTKKELGKNIFIEALRNEYDAVFVGIGAENSNMYDLGTDINVYDSSTFLRSYYNKDFIENLGKVIVIGGGNVAMDCSRAALKMGADTSTICYRRNEEYMPARKIELEEALDEGVKKEFLTRVISFDNKKAKCIRTEIVNGKAQDVSGTEFTIEADTVVFAIGLKPNSKLLQNEKFNLKENGMLSTDEEFMTNIDGVFAGGDVIETKATVCRALASGKNAAHYIINYIEDKGVN